MRSLIRNDAADHVACRFRWTLTPALGLALLSLVAGCNRTSVASASDPTAAKASEEPTVQVVSPQRKTLNRRIEQPGFNIEAFQETPLFPRISGYVRAWNVDIGDHVHKGQVLAELYVPEMVVELRQKEAAVKQTNAQ